MAYTTLTGDPAKGAVPAGEYNVLEDLKAQWEQLAGYTVEISDWALLEFANRGYQTLADMGHWMEEQDAYFKWGKLAAVPWAQYGLTKDDYTSLSTTFGSEYKKLTGQDIPPDQLAQAFTSGQKGAGGLLTGSEYAQQLTNDANIQKTFGWVKYGLDYNAFQQQKLSMRQAFGKDLSNADAVTQLQYFHTNQGANMTVHEQGQQSNQSKQPAGSQSVIR